MGNDIIKHFIYKILNNILKLLKFYKFYNNIINFKF